MSLLSVEDLHIAYGAVEVVKGISIVVEPGEIVTILGSNGAGKTTTLRTIAGLVRPSSGRIHLAGREISGLAPHQISSLGVALVPEGRQLFSEHTVEENLELGAYLRLRRGERRAFRAKLADVLELFPEVRERLHQAAGLLSGGEQQMVAIARALIAGPTLLMLDEPSLGLSPIMVQRILEAFGKLKARGLTVLLVEQMAWTGLEICDRAYVLEAGLITLAGARETIVSNPRIIEAYLGRVAPST